MAAPSVVDFEPVARNYRLDFEDYTTSVLDLPLNGEGPQGTDAGICRFYAKGHCHKGNSCQYQHSKGGKSIVCKHWIRGLCKKGDQCDFLHNFNLAKMPECHFFTEYGVCYAGASCLFIHVDPNAVKAECPWYARGFCKHGPKCRRLHVRRAACQNYITGFCPLGPDCPNAHPRHDLPMPNHGTEYASRNVNDRPARSNDRY
ncbi:RNA-binding component of cleavage and polyadenylation factor [Tieghemiomyces parasiticus]|uniref:mRNA 3'-end-processing protein n=1 Tax=Tieghemiomyces parasiticus TaxID=78921 RepID=A0A9W8DY44_9FUNG|nr:RNA-binding component of cleavage and polyadenylation factor [Tieghemiomyces parasiticus]KAJ1922801.1 RNA-binding component of cleavage and polyadenylation factor [Tieghemiomyces parasiticus]